MRFDEFSPAPILEQHGQLTVVRDDMLDGGSKTRFLPHLVAGADEVVYGGPFCGGAPVALAAVGRRLGIRVTIFYAKRTEIHRRQRQVLADGGTIYTVTPGYMTNVQAKARRYAAERGALFLPLGFDLPHAEEPFVDAMLAVRAQIGSPEAVWCATGSGMLARCLGQAFPESEINAVAVGLRSRHERQHMPSNVVMHDAGVPFDRENRSSCPFPCCPNYDRKAWQRAEAWSQATGKRGLFWNVAG